MKIDPRELAGTYTSSLGAPGSIALSLFDKGPFLEKGLFVESYAGCEPRMRTTFGTWQVDESGVILHPDVAKNERDPGQEVRLIPVLVDGEIDLVHAETEAAFSVAGPTLANHFRRRTKSSYWHEVLKNLELH